MPRQRLSPDQRRTDILTKARALIAAKGFAALQMEELRQQCGLSRGGLYHHFDGKRALLHGLVDQEIAQLVSGLEKTTLWPLRYLLSQASAYLGAGPGILEGLQSVQDRQDYLSALETALIRDLAPPLAARLRPQLIPDADAAHIAELFLVVNGHINRQVLLGGWQTDQAVGFSLTALRALAPFFASPDELAALCGDLAAGAAGRS